MEELLNSITDSNQDKFHLKEKGDQNTEESIVRREVASLIRQTVEDYHSTKDVIDQLLDRLQFEEVKEKYFQELDEDYILIIQNNKQGRKRQNRDQNRKQNITENGTNQVSRLASPTTELLFVRTGTNGKSTNKTKNQVASKPHSKQPRCG